MYRLLIADDSYDQREVIKYFLSQHEKEWLIEEAKNATAKPGNFFRNSPLT